MVNQDTKVIAKNSNAVKNLKKYLPKGKRNLFQFMKGTLIEFFGHHTTIV